MSDLAADFAPEPMPQAVIRKRTGLLRRIGRFLRWSWPFILLISAFVLWNGWQRTSTGGAAGEHFFGSVSSPASLPATSPLPTGTRFRVGSFNIQGAMNDDPAKLPTLAKTFSSVDLVGLQEVRSNALSSDRRNQAQMLGELTGLYWLFAPAERRFWQERGGNGIVSRFPSSGWVRFPLPELAGDIGSCRNVILARVTIAGTNVVVLVTHLDRGRIKPTQALAVAQLMRSLEGPVVLLADVNSGSGDPDVAPMFQSPGFQDALSPKLGRNSGRVDCILVRGLKVINAGQQNDGASDHDFVWAELELPN